MTDDLNPRQKAYLEALYECDQTNEQYRKQRAIKGFWDNTPASEWRWIVYGRTEPASDLWIALRRQKLVDEGSGSTWQALEKRGFVECRWQRFSTGGTYLEVKITPKGRKLVRSWTAEAPKPPRRKKGELGKQHIQALKRLAAAPDGLKVGDLELYVGTWWHTINTLTRLGLITYLHTTRRYCITDAGRDKVAELNVEV